jgi:hypothetical protein
MSSRPVLGRCSVPATGLESLDWASAVKSIGAQGWVRFEGVVSGRTCARLVGEAPTTWQAEPEVIGDVRQSGLSCGVSFDKAGPTVRDVGLTICDSVTNVLPTGTPSLPCFNVATWGRSQDGMGYITTHRDPPAAGGLIAIVTLFGQATFRVWHGTQATEWETADGDLVIVRGNGWPTGDSLCPVHEVTSPVVGDRMTMTLRYNKRGPGADYFA